MNFVRSPLTPLRLAPVPTTVIQKGKPEQAPEKGQKLSAKATEICDSWFTFSSPSLESLATHHTRVIFFLKEEGIALVSSEKIAPRAPSAC